MELENKEICSLCKGRCCKKSGCDYATYDFKDLSTNGLYQALESEEISIVAALKFEKLKTGKLYVNPFLYLRARNMNRPVVDLFSLKTTCSQLTDQGCKYVLDRRPSGGKNLIPKANNRCYPLKNPLEIVDTWQSYQKTLAKLVKKISGYTVEEKLRMDVQNAFYDILTENFENVSKEEIADIKSCILPLIQTYPEEYNSADKKYTMINKK